MTTKTKKISSTQLCLIFIGIFMSVRPIVENALQAKFVGNDCIITCIIAGIINLSFAMIICYVINKNPGKSFYEIMQNLLGKVMTKFIMVLLAVVFLFKMLLIDYQMNFLLYDAIYTDINWILFALPVVITICFVAIKGIKVLSRCYQIFIPFALLIFLVTLFISFGNASFDNILPLFSHTHGEFMIALNYILIQSCEYIFLFTFMENVETKDNHYYSKITTTFALIFILVTTFYIIFIAVLDKLAPFVHESLITMTQFRDNSFGYFKIDIFTTIFWIPLIVLQNAFCVYSISYCLNKAFNFNTTWCSVITVCILFASHFVAQINNQSVTDFFYNKIGIFVLFFVLILPILLLLASFKPQKSKEKKDG